MSSLDFLDDAPLYKAASSCSSTSLETTIDETYHDRKDSHQEIFRVARKMERRVNLTDDCASGPAEFRALFSSTFFHLEVSGEFSILCLPFNIRRVPDPC